MPRHSSRSPRSAPNTTATFIHEYMLYLALRVEDRPAEPGKRCEQLLQRLRDKAIKGLPEGARINYLAAALFSHAISESWRDGPKALALGFRNAAPKLPGANVLRVIASSLVEGKSNV